jgi:predicted DNA-binding protein
MKKEYPRYNVVSVRISDEECALLHQLQRNTAKSISQIMREAIRKVAPPMTESQMALPGR